MQTIKDYVSSYFNLHQDFLKNTYPGINVQILLREFVEYSRREENELMQRADLAFFEKVVEGIPLEYIKSETYFYRSYFYINQNVLIPRDETEILVEDSVSFLKKYNYSQFKIAEVGVGSFALGLSLLAELDLPVSFWGGDISGKALKVAKTNLFRLRHKVHPKSRIQLVLSDRLEMANEQFHFIVSNPPYIREQDIHSVHPMVSAHEPHVALFLPDAQYTQWFESFFKETAKMLLPEGAFFMEGHEDTLEELAKMAQSYFTKVAIKNDYTGRMRFLHCYK